MNDEQVIEYLSKLPHEQLADLLRRVFSVIQPAPAESSYCRNRFYLGTAWSDLLSDEGEPERWEPWQLDAVAYMDPAQQPDGLGPDHGLCEEGSCQACGTRVGSNVKHGLCAICGHRVGMT